MSELPLVTVAIVTHQFEQFIERAIDSALAMDWPADRLDVLIIDDGSTDSTSALVAGYGDRVRYVHKPNEGVVASVALSFSMSRGDFIAPLAGDDECTVDRLRRQVPVLLERPEVGLVYGDMELIDAASRTIAPSFREAMGLVCQQGRCLGPLLSRNSVSGGAALIRSSMLAHVLPMPPEAVWEDWWTALKVAEVAEIAYLDEPIYRYRHHGRNMNLGAPPEKVVGLLRRELPFRRWLMRGEAVSLTTVPRSDLRAAVMTFDDQAASVATSTGEWLHDLLEITDRDRHRADAAFAADDPLRALSFDPGHAGARAAFDIVQATPPPIAAPGVVTVALVNDVIAQPDLFASYERSGCRDGAATLVLYAPGRRAADVQAELLAAIPRLADDDAPDVLLYAVPPMWATERALLDRATRVLRAEPIALAA